mgnify:CR=1 FL=1
MPASLPRRLGAMIYDSLLLVAVLMLVTGLMHLATGGETKGNGRDVKLERAHGGLRDEGACATLADRWRPAYRRSAGRVPPRTRATSMLRIGGLPATKETRSMIKLNGSSLVLGAALAVGVMFVMGQGGPAQPQYVSWGPPKAGVVNIFIDSAFTTPPNGYVSVYQVPPDRWVTITDAQIAATAIRFDAKLVTRNADDFADFPVEIIDPWPHG